MSCSCVIRLLAFHQTFAYGFAYPIGYLISKPHLLSIFNAILLFTRLQALFDPPHNLCSTPALLLGRVPASVVDGAGDPLVGRCDAGAFFDGTNIFNLVCGSNRLPSGSLLTLYVIPHPREVQTVGKLPLVVVRSKEGSVILSSIIGLAFYGLFDVLRLMPPPLYLG